MIVEFMLNNIKNIDYLYSIEEKYNEDFDLNFSEEHYLGTDYCKSIIYKLKSNFSEIENYTYKGQTNRVAHEEFSVNTSKKEYSVEFTIDTFKDRTQTQLSVRIISLQDNLNYDIFLEKIKIYLKEILLKEWEMCTWITDEQSEHLGMELYPLIYNTENNMRAFINKVLTFEFGVRWMELIGLEDIIKGHNRSYVDFKREVPEFNNINDFLICSTVESLAKLMFKSKVYESNIMLSENESLRLHEFLAEKKANAVFELLLDSRKVKVELWKDIFEKYFDDSIQNEITNFIKNRNHIAHNKLLTKKSCDKIVQNISNVKCLFQKANELFINNEPSDKLCETWNAEEEKIRNEKEYLQYRIKNETGIDVLFREEIFELFEGKVEEIYNEIDDLEYFNYSVDITPLKFVNSEAESQVIFSVNSHVDNKFSFDVCAYVDITEDMGQDSFLNLWIQKLDGEKLLETSIMYHNGEAYEDKTECYYVPNSESYFEIEKINRFICDVGRYMNNDMNTLKLKVDAILFDEVKNTNALPVANFPCCNCNQNYISIDENIYPYGKCINCGEENDVCVCEKCGMLYPSDEGGEYMGIYCCNHCLEKIEKE